MEMEVNSIFWTEPIMAGKPAGRPRPNLFKWLQQREFGYRTRPVDRERVCAEAYSSVRPVVRWNAINPLNHPGAIFNLEYNRSGSLLAAACEHNSVQFFDPISHQYIYSLETGHANGVNGVKFLDDHMFATYSDDFTVALWDVRQFNTRIRILNGHSSSVKNVEYLKKDNLLITSGFDGNIYMWDLKSYTENGLVYKRVFQTNGLMRMVISPDASKLVISTTGGYIMVVHNLNLDDFSNDLEGFKPNMFRLMQLSGIDMPDSSMFWYLFDKHRKQNRVEVITDFPQENIAESVSSLQMHPEGWCVLSRNSSSNELSEWSCVHDIQDTEPYEPPTEELLAEAECSRHQIASGVSWTLRSVYQNGPFRRINYYNPNPMDSHFLANARRILRSRSGVEYSDDELNSEAESENGSDEDQPSASNDGSSSAGSSVQDSDGNPGDSNSDSDNSEAGPSSPGRRRTCTCCDRTVKKLYNVRRRTVFVVSADRQPNGLPLVRPSLSNPERKAFFRQNKKRLTHFVQEANIVRGFIKESSFSADGRVICSPNGDGVRLFAFDSSCTELSRLKMEPGAPQKLHSLGKVWGHTTTVLCSKFAPQGYSLASGCCDGNITLYQPVL